jgi:hypothetical protein
MCEVENLLEEIDITLHCRFQELASTIQCLSSQEENLRLGCLGREMEEVFRRLAEIQGKGTQIERICEEIRTLLGLRRRIFNRAVPHEGPISDWEMDWELPDDLCGSNG